MKYKFDVNVKTNKYCGNFSGHVATCQEISIFQPLPFACQGEYPCYEISGDSLDPIACSGLQPQNNNKNDSDEIFGCVGCFSQGVIEDQYNADEMKNLATESAETAMLKLLTDLGTKLPENEFCGINLVSVENYQSQV